MSSGVTYITKCKLSTGESITGMTPCRFNITDYALEVSEVGKPDPRVQKFIGALMTHLGKKHPEAAAAAQGMAGTFFGYLAISAFDSPDPAIETMRREFENRMRRMITPEMITDGDIEQALGMIGFTMDDPHRGLTERALRHLRDYYEGKLSEQTTKSAPQIIIPA